MKKLKLYWETFLKIYKEDTKGYTIYQRLWGEHYLGLLITIVFIIFSLMWIFS